MAAYGSVSLGRSGEVGAKAGRRPGRRAEILAHAAQLFSERGYLRTSLEDIAGSLGITREALYHHFPNKNQIFLEIMLAPTEAMVGRLDAILKSEASPTEKFRLAVANHIGAYMPNYLDMIIALREDHEMQNDRSFAKLRMLEREYNGTWGKLIREGRERGEFRLNAPEKVIVFAVLGMCNWLARWFDPAKDLSADAVAAIFSDLVLFGLASSPPAEFERWLD